MENWPAPLVAAASTAAAAAAAAGEKSHHWINHNKHRITKQLVLGVVNTLLNSTINSNTLNNPTKIITPTHI